MTSSPVFPASQEAAYGRLLRLIDSRVGNGFLIPCRGAESSLWVSEHIADQRIAAAECSACPVRTACRDYAAAFPETAGVWGGTTSTDRKATRHRENAA